MAIGDDPEAIARLVRILAASVNVAILRALVLERERRGEDGWLFLSEIAERIGEKPGTVVLAVEKLAPLLEERREKGKRYFRSRVEALSVTLAIHPAEAAF